MQTASPAILPYSRKHRHAACHDRLQVPVPSTTRCFLLVALLKGTDYPQVYTLSKTVCYTELLFSPQSLPLPWLLLSKIFLKDLKRYSHFPLSETFGNFREAQEKKKKQQRVGPKCKKNQQALTH